MYHWTEVIKLSTNKQIVELVSNKIHILLLLLVRQYDQ